MISQLGEPVLNRLEERCYLIRTEHDRLTTRIKRRTAHIRDGQYYAFNYDKIMEVDCDDCYKPEDTPLPTTTRFTCCRG